MLLLCMYIAAYNFGWKVVHAKNFRVGLVEISYATRLKFRIVSIKYGPNTLSVLYVWVWFGERSSVSPSVSEIMHNSGLTSCCANLAFGVLDLLLYSTPASLPTISFACLFKLSFHWVLYSIHFFHLLQIFSVIPDIISYHLLMKFKVNIKLIIFYAKVAVLQLGIGLPKVKGNALTKRLDYPDTRSWADNTNYWHNYNINFTNNISLF